jgi:hypothetical protein
MLDVHPPHQAAHSWKDFFTHIATIVLGLLIAIGLEQTVEFFHHRHQLKEAQEQFSVEGEKIRGNLETNLKGAATLEAELDHDLALLRTCPTSPGKQCLQLNYTYGTLYQMPTSVWDSAKQHDSLSLMDQGELNRLSYRYYMEGVINQQGADLFAAFSKAQAIAQRSSYGPLTPHDTEELLTATSEAQTSISVFKRYLNYQGRSFKPR